MVLAMDNRKSYRDLTLTYFYDQWFYTTTCPKIQAESSGLENDCFIESIFYSEKLDSYPSEGDIYMLIP